MFLLILYPSVKRKCTVQVIFVKRDHTKYSIQQDFNFMNRM